MLLKKGIGVRNLFKRKKALGNEFEEQEKENLLPRAVDEDLHDM